MNELYKEIAFLSGVGPKKAEVLEKEVGVATFIDLLYYFPYKHIDKTKFYDISEINGELPYIQIKGRITNFRTEGTSPKERLIATFTDGKASIELVWFKGIKWIKSNYNYDTEYIIFGKPNEFNHKINIPHPEIEIANQRENGINYSMQPAYSTTEKMKTFFMTSKFIENLQKKVIPICLQYIEESLPDYLLKMLRLLPLEEALVNIHFPKNADLLAQSQYRLKFEELFFIQLNLFLLKKNRTNKIQGLRFEKVGDYFNSFYKNNLPFDLTNAQKRVLKEMRFDMGSGKQMNRLLQGDVGSGKTLVALMTMLLALDNGFQACLMAPTEILANQHYQTICSFLNGMEVNVQLLTGSTRKSRRNELHQELQNGNLQILIGTHALIEDEVQFSNLGLVIIDEQHRFGVEQRAKLWKKNTRPPHIIVMTATPIPRTLAMTLYGDLDISFIDELPPGRKPITTHHVWDSKRLKIFDFMRKQIAAGRQIYIVYPLINESEKLDLKTLEDGVESISRVFPSPQYGISVVHGKMKAEEKEKSMQYFVKGITQIMVATTVIEVGVNVPNASVMIIENADRFGLSQLHQLRGRVGRGAEQSYCLLMTPYKISADAKKRLNAMVSTNNGFEIAEMDMRLRGPGDIEGTQQSGVPFSLRIANLTTDSQILQQARDVASQIIEQDPQLSQPENLVLIQEIHQKKFKKFSWSSIS